jgi:hypothetical protein
MGLAVAEARLGGGAQCGHKSTTAGSSNSIQSPLPAMPVILIAVPR